MEIMVDRPLLSPRAALIFLFALLTGAAASGLTAGAGEGVAHSVLAGLAATGLAVPFFNRLIAVEDSTAQPRTSTVEEESNG
ncbi:hypothetical protein [Streptomyces sp. NPDC001056]